MYLLIHTTFFFFFIKYSYYIYLFLFTSKHFWWLHFFFCVCIFNSNCFPNLESDIQFCDKAPGKFSLPWLFHADHVYANNPAQ